jgi:prepilin peptidase CpaA
MAMAITIGTAAAAEDLLHRRISNWIPLAALGSGLVLHTVERGWRGTMAAGAGAACGFGVFLVFYLLGGMGGGDVKLMAGFGAILGGAGMLLQAALWVAGIGGIFAMAVLGARMLRGRKKKDSGASAAAGSGNDPKEKESIPYAPAIAVGVWLSLLAAS